MERYRKQIIIEEFGEEKQKLLLNSKVLVIGAGGLGCPALLYLSAAGIGTIGIADYDTVDISNLHRQIIYNKEDIGNSKAITAANKLSKSYSDCVFIPHNHKIDGNNILELIKAYDVIIDGTDSLETRYIINDACYLTGKPWIYGAVYKFEGQLSVFIPGSVNYRDLFPEPSIDLSPTCNDTGVLGPLTGIVGSMQAGEAIKIISGIGEIAVNKLVHFNITDLSWNITEFPPNPELTNCIPQTTDEFKLKHKKIDKSTLSGGRIDPDQLASYMKNDKTILVDLREDYEINELYSTGYMWIPLADLRERQSELMPYDTVIFFCNSGNKSRAAAFYMQKIYPEKQIQSVNGGFKELIKLNILKPIES